MKILLVVLIVIVVAGGITWASLYYAHKTSPDTSGTASNSNSNNSQSANVVKSQDEQNLDQIGADTNTDTALDFTDGDTAVSDLGQVDLSQVQ